MLVSLRNKFIFYHIPKTGGMSVRRALQDYDDIIQDYYKHNLNKKINGKKLWKIDARHANQEEIEPLYDFSDFTEFTVVREPLKRIVSLYNYGENIERFPSFKLFARVIYKHYRSPSSFRVMYNSQLHWITDKTTVLKLEDIINDPISEFRKVNLDVASFPKENENTQKKYFPNKEELLFCLDFLSDEYTKLGYSKPTL